jgi:hypothetical protein
VNPAPFAATNDGGALRQPTEIMTRHRNRARPAGRRLLRGLVDIDHHERVSASSKTAQILMVAFVAYLLGGFTSIWAIAIGTAVLALGLFMVIRDFWKVAATPQRAT